MIWFTQLMYIFVLLITLKYYSALSTPTMIILLVLASLSSSPKRLLLCFWEQKQAGEDGEGTQIWAIYLNFAVPGE